MNQLLRIILFLGNILGLNYLFRIINAKKIRILMYHCVSLEPPLLSSWTILSVAKFRWQMKYIKKHYNNIQASTVFCRNNSKHPKVLHGLIISFDDGYESVCNNTWPILKEMGLKAICFVIPGLSKLNHLIWADFVFDVLTNYSNIKINLRYYGIKHNNFQPNSKESLQQANRIIHKMKSWPQEKREIFVKELNNNYNIKSSNKCPFKLMTLDQIAFLSDSKEFEIGLHSNSHPILSSLNSIQQRDEIEFSVSNLKLYGIPYVPIFAYPNGRLVDFNQKTIAILKKYGFKAGFTTIDNLYDGGDPFYVPRILIGSNISKSEFKARLSGFYYFLYSIFNH